MSAARTCDAVARCRVAQVPPMRMTLPTGAPTSRGAIGESVEISSSQTRDHQLGPSSGEVVSVWTPRAVIGATIAASTLGAACGRRAPQRVNPPLAPVAVPATAPDTLPAGFRSDSNTVWPSASSIWAAPFTKQAVFVDFKATSSVEARTAAVRLVHGTVVGGTHGYYMLRVPDDGSGAGIKAATDALRALPAVNFASGDFGNYIVPDADGDPSLVARGNAFIIRGVVVNASKKPVSAAIHFGDGAPDIHTDKLGEFHFVRSSRDSLRLTVDAEHYFNEYVVIHPGRDSVVRVVLMSFVKLSPITGGDGPPAEGVGEGVAVAFARLAGAAPIGDSIRIILASKKLFRCGSGLAVTRSTNSTELSLKVTYVLTGFCRGDKSRGTWRTLIPATSPLPEIVVVVNGHTDRFALRSTATGLCVVAVEGPRATPLISGPFPTENSRARRNKESLEMIGFPDDRLPAC
jgi:hypothetical protein